MFSTQLLLHLVIAKKKKKTAIVTHRKRCWKYIENAVKISSIVLNLSQKTSNAPQLFFCVCSIFDVVQSCYRKTHIQNQSERLAEIHLSQRIKYGIRWNFLIFYWLISGFKNKSNHKTRTITYFIGMNVIKFTNGNAYMYVERFVTLVCLIIFIKSITIKCRCGRSNGSLVSLCSFLVRCTKGLVAVEGFDTVEKVEFTLHWYSIAFDFYFAAENYIKLS